ncbi:MAG: hypothetical protein IJY73_00890 [Oscillospiraceae bacterium]|nr:hypothetical protein [Oscillospiraceae bacterium]
MRSAKTDKIMNLIGAEQAEKTNPLLRIPESEEIPVIFRKTSPGTQLINVVFLLLNEQLGTVMERFHCCTCEKCAAAVSLEVMKRYPPVIVKVKRKTDADEVNRLAAQHRSEIISSLTKAVISVKSNPPHRSST